MSWCIVYVYTELYFPDRNHFRHQESGAKSFLTCLWQCTLCALCCCVNAKEPYSLHQDGPPQKLHHWQSCWAPRECEPGGCRIIARWGSCFNSRQKQHGHQLLVSSKVWGEPQGWRTCCQAFASSLRDGEWGEQAGGLSWRMDILSLSPRDKTTIFISDFTSLPRCVSTMRFLSSSLFLPIFNNKIVPYFPPKWLLCIFVFIFLPSFLTLQLPAFPLLEKKSRQKASKREYLKTLIAIKWSTQ